MVLGAVTRRSLTFWIDESTIQVWYDETKTSSRGRPQRYSELAISTVLMLKRVFHLTLRAAQGFCDCARSVNNSLTVTRLFTAIINQHKMYLKYILC